jgi:hypothetical protein
MSMTLLLALFPSTITSADTNDGIELIESYKEIKGDKELDKILEKFEANEEIPENITITKENSKVEIEQNLKKCNNNSGEILEQNSLTTIEDIQIPVENNGIMPLASQGDDGSDTSSGCKASSTIYYDKSTKMDGTMLMLLKLLGVYHVIVVLKFMLLILN